MVNDENYFPEDYITEEKTSPSEATEEKYKKELDEQENKEAMKKYGISKPVRIIIKARIIDDKD